MPIKKRLLFLYRYLRSSRLRRRWINTQSVMIVVVSAVFLFTLSWTAPYATDTSAAASDSPSIVLAQAATVAPPEETASSEPSEPTHTPYPPEYDYNSTQTIGITLAGAVLVMIVVIGVLLYMPQKTEDTTR